LRRWLGNRNIIKAQRLNLGIDRVMRSATMFRAVKSAIVTFTLAGSCANTLRCVWRCFRPICKLNTIICKGLIFYIHYDFNLKIQKANSKVKRNGTKRASERNDTIRYDASDTKRILKRSDPESKAHLICLAVLSNQSKR
jgi:hypothetical protein